MAGGLVAILGGYDDLPELPLLRGRLAPVTGVLTTRALGEWPPILGPGLVGDITLFVIGYNSLIWRICS